MARALGIDLRRRVIAARQEGDTVEETAERFSVSISWVSKVYRHYLATGSEERPACGKRGRKAKVTEELGEWIKAKIGEQSDLTLAEIQLALLEQKEVYVSIGCLHGTLGRLGLRRKKKRSTQASRTVSG